MNNAERTFVDFLRVLQETLDEPDATSADMASRCNLSRFHADRLVSATAGESPAALRRRILLERAAYELSNGSAGVLSIALNAGFDSHEGFTRAFNRAYGHSPTSWRQDPTSIALDAPSRVHFHPPAGLKITSDRRPEMDLATRMIEHHVWVIGQLLDRAQELTDEQLNAPITLSVEGVDDDPTVRRLLARLAGQMAMWLASVESRPYDFDAEQSMTLPQISSVLDDVGPQFLELVRRTADSNAMDDTFIDATCEPPNAFTFGGMVAHVMTFAAHRRTLVAGALYSAGITDLGAADPLQWFGEQRP